MEINLKFLKVLKKRIKKASLVYTINNYYDQQLEDISKYFHLQTFLDFFFWFPQYKIVA